MTQPGITNPQSIVTDGTSLYFANGGTQILKVSLSTGGVSSFGTYTFGGIYEMAYRPNKDSNNSVIPGSGVIYVNNLGTSIVAVTVGGSSDGQASVMTLSGASLNGNALGIACDGGDNLYLFGTLDTDAGALYQVVISTGVVTRISGVVSGAPFYLCHDEAHTLYATDINGATLYIVDLTDPSSPSSTTKTAPTGVNGLQGITIRNGVLYIADAPDDGVVSYTLPNGSVGESWGNGTNAFIVGPRQGNLDAQGSAAAFIGLRNLVSVPGSVFIYGADADNNSVRQIGTVAPYPVLTYAANVPTDPSNLTFIPSDNSITLRFNGPNNAANFNIASYNVVDYDWLLNTYTTYTLTPVDSTFSYPYSYTIPNLVAGVRHDITINAVTDNQVNGCALNNTVYTTGTALIGNPASDLSDNNFVVTGIYRGFSYTQPIPVPDQFTTVTFSFTLSNTLAGSSMNVNGVGAVGIIVLDNRLVPFGSGGADFTSAVNFAAGDVITFVETSTTLTIFQNGAQIFQLNWYGDSTITGAHLGMIVNVLDAGDAISFNNIGYSVSTTNPSNNTSLTNFWVNGVDALTGYASGNTVNISYSSSSTARVALTAGSTNTITSATYGSGTACTSVPGGYTFPISAGSQVQLNVVVTAQDGTTTQTYMVMVSKASLPLSDDTSLNTFTVDGVDALTGYASGNVVDLSYSSSSTATVAVTAGSTNTITSVTYGSGTACTSVPGGYTFPISAGSQVQLNVVVTAQDGTTTQNYMVMVSKASPSSDSSLSTFTINGATLGSFSPLAYDATSTSIQVVPTSSSASVTVTYGPDTSPPSPVSLDAGGNGTVTLTTGGVLTIVVTAQDGSTSTPYNQVIPMNSAPSGGPTSNDLTIEVNQGAIATDGTNLYYVGDAAATQISKVTPNGIVSAFASSYNFTGIYNMVVLGSNLYVNDSGSLVSVSLSSGSGSEVTLSGADSYFAGNCYGLTTDGTYLYTANVNYSTCYRITTSGTVTTLSVAPPSGSAPNYVCVNQGVLYATDLITPTLLHIMVLETNSYSSVDAGSVAQSLNGLTSASGTLYLTAVLDGYVLSYNSSTGTFTVIGGTGVQGFSDATVGTNATFEGNDLVAMGSALYIADDVASPIRIQQISLTVPNPVTTYVANVPTEPLNLAASSIGKTSFTISWSAPFNASNFTLASYKIQYSSNQGALWSPATAISTSSTTTSLTGLSAGTAYIVRVKETTSSKQGINGYLTVITNSDPASAQQLSDAQSALANILSNPSTALTSFVTNNPSSQVSLALRSGIKAITDSSTRNVSKAQYLASVLANGKTTLDSGGNNGVIVMNGSDVATQFTNTFDSVSATNPPNSTLPFFDIIPKFSTGSSPYTATLNLSDTIFGNSYVYYMLSGTANYCFELPLSVSGSVYELTLTYQAASLTLSYIQIPNSSPAEYVLLDSNGMIYNANSSLQVGNLRIPLIGLGSPAMQAAAVNLSALTSITSTYKSSLTTGAFVIQNLSGTQTISMIYEKDYVTYLTDFLNTSNLEMTFTNGSSSHSTPITLRFVNREVIEAAIPVTADYTALNAFLTTNTTYTITVGQSGTTGGGGGDPYVTTFSGIQYKLPAIDAPIRYFQTMEEGKLLTINAQLKTCSSSDLDASNIRSLLALKNKMTAKQYGVIAQKLMTPETLSFFERVHIQYGDESLVMNLWNSKFEVLKNNLSVKAKVVERPDLIAKTGIYTGYKGKTLQFTFGSTRLMLSVYNSPMIRNGLSIETSAKNCNGVIVNALKQSDMVLPLLDSVTPVLKKDSAKRHVHTETFVDHDGLRTRNIVTYR